MDTVFFQIETNGFPLWGKPSGDELQPHIVRISAIKIDSNYEINGTFDAIVKPEGWQIPAEAEAVHGISHSHALSVGDDEKSVLNTFFEFVGNNAMVAWTKPFDAKILRIGLKRYADEEQCESLKNREGFLSLKQMLINNKHKAEAKLNLLNLNARSKLPDFCSGFSVETPDKRDSREKVMTYISLYKQIYN